MRFYWLRCRDSQGQFQYYWKPGPTNQADYYTKHHPAHHHIEQRPKILTPKLILDALRASTNRTPAIKGKGLAKPTNGKAKAAWKFKLEMNSQWTLKGCVGSRAKGLTLRIHCPHSVSRYQNPCHEKDTYTTDRATQLPPTGQVNTHLTFFCVPP